MDRNMWSDRLWMDAFYSRKMVDDGESMEAEDRNMDDFKSILRQIDDYTGYEGCNGEGDVDSDLRTLWEMQAEQQRNRKRNSR